MPIVNAVVPPVGGAIFLSITASSNITIVRTPQSTGVPVQIYSGPAVSYYIDQGEGYSTNVEYLPNDTYTYTVTDSSGSVVTAPLTTSASVLITPDQITSVIIKLIKAGINNLILTQPGWIKPRVFHALPTSGTPQLPFIVVTFDLLQQNAVPVGQMNMPEYNNTIDISVLVDRRYTVTTYTTTVDEREFYRDALIAIFESSLFTPLQQLGQDVSHSFQAVSIQETDPSPGFYVTDMMWMMTGAYSITLQTDYGLIESLDIGGINAQSTTQPL